VAAASDECPIKKHGIYARGSELVARIKRKTADLTGSSGRRI